jgi:tetratricopeptide (TPR) repeat protein
VRSIGDEVKRIVRNELPEDLPKMDMILIDEMWHYTKKYIQNATEATFQRGIIAENQARYEDASKHFAKAVRLVDDNLNYINQLLRLAISLSELGQYQQAEPLCKKILEIHRDKLGENHRDTAGSYNNLAVSVFK